MVEKKTLKIGVAVLAGVALVIGLSVGLTQNKNTASNAMSASNGMGVESYDFETDCEGVLVSYSDSPGAKSGKSRRLGRQLQPEPEPAGKSGKSNSFSAKSGKSGSVSVKSGKGGTVQLVSFCENTCVELSCAAQEGYGESGNGDDGTWCGKAAKFGIDIASLRQKAGKSGKSTSSSGSAKSGKSTSGSGSAKSGKSTSSSGSAKSGKSTSSSGSAKSGKSTSSSGSAKSGKSTSSSGSAKSGKSTSGSAKSGKATTVLIETICGESEPTPSPTPFQVEDTPMPTIAVTEVATEGASPTVAAEASSGVSEQGPRANP